jgi:ketosteroid isomerase-like protein
MSPTTADRDVLFKTFGRAFFKRDLDLMYQVVTPDFVWASQATDGSVTALRTREAIAAHFADQAKKVEGTRFHDVVYHHASDATFMTFRMTHTEIATGRSHDEIGVERYTFRDGRIALKDVYRKKASSQVAGSTNDDR